MIVFVALLVLLRPARPTEFLVLLAISAGFSSTGAIATSQKVWPFVRDYRVYLLLLVLDILLACVTASTFQTGQYGGLTQLEPIVPRLAILISGFFIATVSGDELITRFLGDAQKHKPATGPIGSEMIGRLERALAFYFVIFGSIEAVGFLIAAKAALRFGSEIDDHDTRNFVILGTFASFGWGVMVAIVIKLVWESLPSLGIFPATP